VYRVKVLKIAPGDRIVFTKNDKVIGVKNGQIGVVQKITEDGKVTVQIGKETKKFNISQYNYLDYGYAVTAYKSQGQTVDIVLYHVDSKGDPKKTLSYNQAYVAVTRGRHNLKCISPRLDRTPS